MALAAFLSLLLGGLCAIGALLGIALRTTANKVRSIENDTLAPLYTTQKLLLGLWAASLVVVLACAVAAIAPDDFNRAVAVACSTVSLSSTSLLLLLCSRGRLALDDALWRGHSLGAGYSLFCSLWWAGAVVVVTFVGPFTSTSNAYFACWSALAFSCALLFETTGVSASAREIATGEKRALYGVLIAAAVLFSSSVPKLPSSAEAVYLLTGAVLSAVGVAALLLRAPKLPPAARTLLVILNCLLWVSLVWLGTICLSGPFQVTGNGYFSSWLGGACALLALLLDAKRAEADSSVADVRHAAGRHHLLLLGLASLVVVLGAADGRSGLRLYALFTGGVSLALVATVFIHRAVKEAEANALMPTVACTARGTALTVHALLAAFLSLWWGVGAAVLTFAGPFTSTSNAYFATWLALACAWAMLTGSLPPSADGAEAAGESGERRALTALSLASCVLLGACAAVRVQGTGTGFALVVCVLTLAVSLAYAAGAAPRGPPAARTAVALVLVGLWAVAVALTTFAGPFVESGNGYFAAWLGLGSAAALATADAGARRLLACTPCCGQAANLVAASRHEREGLTLDTATDSGLPTPDSSSGAAGHAALETALAREAAIAASLAAEVVATAGRTDELSEGDGGMAAMVDVDMDEEASSAVPRPRPSAEDAPSYFATTSGGLDGPPLVGAAMADGAAPLASVPLDAEVVVTVDDDDI